MTTGEVALLALAGGLLALDRVAVGQFGFSQPIVAGPLVGWLLGDPGAGLLLGGTLQLLYAGALPVGASVQPDEATAALVAAAAAAVGERAAGVEAAGGALFALALLAGLAAGEAARGLDVWVRRVNVWFAHRADAAAARADDRAVGRLALGGLGLWFAVGALAAALLAPLAALAAGWGAARLAGAAPIWLATLCVGLLALAFGSALVAMRAPGRVALFAGAFAAGTALAAAAGFGRHP